MAMQRFPLIPFLACAALLLAGCSDGDAPELAPPPPPAAPVATQLLVSVNPAAAQPRAGRQTSDVVQSEGTFRGIERLWLYPVIAATTDASGEYRPAGSSAIAGLPLVQQQPAIDAARANSHVCQAQLPVRTNGFVGYACAPTGGADLSDDAPAARAARFRYGSLLAPDLVAVPAGDGVGALRFAPVRLLGTDDNAEQAALAAILNAPLGVVVNGAQWMAASPAPLGDLFTAYTGLTAGSAANVRAVMEDLYNTLRRVQATQPLAAALVAEIEKHFTATEELGLWTLQFRAPNTYPAGLALPDGVIAARYDAAARAFALTNRAGTATQAAARPLVYPLPLWYALASPLRTAAQPMAQQYLGGTWADFLAQYTAADNRAVQASTQSVAVVAPLRYAVACLASRVRLEANHLNDARGKLIAAPAAGYPVTGVLVGGQSDALGWDFRPAPEAQPTCAVYDPVPNAPAPATQVAATTAAFADIKQPHYYTLVGETPAVVGTPSPTNTRTAVVALELLNTGDDFHGAEGLVARGTRFYLAAHLDLAAAWEGGAPAVGDAPVDRLFARGCTTEARFTVRSLAGAHNVVPDLRSPSLDLSLTVALHWQSGITVEQEVPLGND